MKFYVEKYDDQLEAPDTMINALSGKRIRYRLVQRTPRQFWKLMWISKRVVLDNLDYVDLRELKDSLTGWP